MNEKREAMEFVKLIADLNKYLQGKGNAKNIEQYLLGMRVSK